MEPAMLQAPVECDGMRPSEPIYGLKAALPVAGNEIPKNMHAHAHAGAAQKFLKYY
jgi:hypothetical protein